MEKRPNILKLATKICLEGMTYTGVTYDDPEYNILAPIVDDEMCEVMMHMRMEKNRTVEEIARKAGKDVAYTQKQLDKLQTAGIIRSREDEKGRLCYYYPIWVPGIMEGILSNREQCDKYPVLGECFEEYTRRRTAIMMPNAAPGMALMRIIPVPVAIKNDTKAASYDEVSGLIERATAISVGPCSCRRARRLMGEGCGHLEDDMCMYLNDNARTYVKSGAHRMITKEEAYEILQRAEDNGLIHELNQSGGFEETTAICNCCHCSCFALRLGSYFSAPDMLRSNYVAVIDSERCTACGSCVENCHMNALKLGKKLCSVNPMPAPEKDPLPADHFWGKKYYNEDFRTDRTDVMEGGTAPCKAATSASLPIQGYLKLVSQGRTAQALKMISHYIPFPAVAGRVADDLPERVCTRNQLDDPVAINDVLRFVGDFGLEDGNRYVPEMLNDTGVPFDNKMAVVGAGPAGLSCAYYLRVKGYPVTVFEKEQEIGGKLRYGIPSFKLEKDVVEKELKVLEDLGVEFKTGVEIGKDITIAGLQEQGYEAVFLGIGTSGEAKLGCPGQDASGVMGVLEFAKKVNEGKKFAVGTDVLVFGGSVSAVDCARSALRLGASKVTVVCDQLRTDIRDAREEGVEFLFGYKPVKVNAGKSGKVSSVTVAKGSDTKDLKATTVVSDGQKVNLNGIIPEVKILADLNGKIRAEEMTYQTSVPFIFTGGDTVSGSGGVLDAMTAGREAAISMHRFVHEGQNLVFGRDHFDYTAFDVKNTLLPAEAKKDPARQVGSADPKAAVKSFRDTRPVLDKETAKKEASRCLGCGVVEINENMCVGCGVCTTKCSFGAIRLEKVRDDAGQSYFKTVGRIGANAVGRYAKITLKTVTKPLQGKDKA